jgi:broad specificity phosphatase PhoE
MSIASKTLIILRHAHRNKSEGLDEDNGLSKKGQGQAKKIKKHFLKIFRDEKKTKPKFFSSPKKRCLETIQGIAESQKTEVSLSPNLDEGGNIAGKVAALMKSFESEKAPVIVLCSHGDVIPFLTQKLIGLAIPLDKGGWIQLKQIDGEFELEWLYQNFDAERF